MHEEVNKSRKINKNENKRWLQVSLDTGETFSLLRAFLLKSLGGSVFRQSD